MANNFSIDPAVKALWRFEPGALSVDAIGSNTLSLLGSPTVDTTDPMEGGGCALISRSSDQGLYISDANLDSLFPLKTGDTAKIISVCGWFKPETSQSAVICAKYSGSGDSFMLVQNYSSWSLGYWYGGSANWWQYVGSIASGVAYHFGLVIDGINQTVLLRIWDGNAAISYDTTFAGAIDVGASQFSLGNHTGGGAIDGRLDEIVVFGRLLSNQDIDAIRQGTYTGPITNVTVDGLGIDVAYWLTEKTGTVELDSLGVDVAYYLSVVSKRIFPLPPANRLKQSQGWKRIFPV